MFYIQKIKCLYRIYWTARSQTWIMFADFQLTERNSTRGEEVEVGRGGIELWLERQEGELRTREIELEIRRRGR